MYHPIYNKRKSRNPLITGTLMLTSAGLISRIMGFFNRIYLSQLIGAKEMGIYQLTFPVYMVVFALSCHGIELALSHMTAAICSKTGSAGTCKTLVRTASILSFILSLLFSVLVYQFADFISIHLLNEKSSAVCLKLMAPVFPFTALRSCLHGYYIGTKKTFVPAAGQLVEQTVRIFVIWLIADSYGDKITFHASLAICGMVIGEIAGTIYTYISYKIQLFSTRSIPKGGTPSSSFLRNTKMLLLRALPLTGNKLSLTLFSSLESVLIPFMLTKYYNNQDLALSMYGVLTGMALPFITFPSALTNSLSVMLLPTISEAHASNHKKQIYHTIKKTVHLCLMIGFAALILFCLFGRKIGTYVFHNSSAGDFLFLLSFLCPFLYLSSSGTSILNGLGLMKDAFFISLTGILIRLLFILFAIPKFGIQGYLIGLLAGQLALAGLQWYKIRRSI